MNMYGADVERLEQAAREMRLAADELDGHAHSLDRTLSGFEWIGQLATAFVSMWNGGHRPRMGSTADFIRDAAAKLDAHARAQRQASAAESVPVPAWKRRLPTPFGSGVDRHTPHEPEARVVGLAQYFDRQAGLAQDEFEIMRVSDDPPRYVVNLPGVEFNAEGRWEQEHLRDLRGASAARLHAHDAYAERVKLELQRAGVPAGAEVMLVGHSYGAIAAMNIASDHEFNRPGDSGRVDGYSVQITHVLAAGAGVQDWIDDPPAGTNVLVAINRNDAVAAGIQAGDLDPTSLLGANPIGHLGRRLLNDVTDDLDHRYTAQGSERMVVEFSANDDLIGHGFNNYERGLNGMGARAGWFEDEVGRRYFAGGGGMQSVRVKLPDQI